MTQATPPINFLYQEIEKLHGAAPWGDVLDAGTGTQSLNWLLSLNTDSCTAVTGAQGMAASVKTKLGDRLRVQDQIIVGNWKDQALLKGQQYDYVIADYLLGAIEGFAPYWQDCLFDRLHPLVKKKLYFVGLEPYVPYYPKSVAGKMVCKIGRLRDACLLLANERTYREFPLDWVVRHMYQANYRVLEVKQYGIKYGERFVNSQLNMCVQRMQKIENQALATSMLAHIEALRERALRLTAEQDGLQYGFDYVIVAEPL